jgi:hypothetical protein
VDPIRASRRRNVSTIVYKQFRCCSARNSRSAGRELVEHFGAQLFFPDLN